MLRLERVKDNPAKSKNALLNLLDEVKIVYGIDNLISELWIEKVNDFHGCI